MGGKTLKQSLHCPNCGALASQDSVRCEFCRSVLSLTACPSCFGPVFKGMKFCPACGKGVNRTDIDLTDNYTCPRCDEILSTVDLEGTRISECLSCGGIWLDKQTFQRICHEKEHQERALIYPYPTRTANINPETNSGRMYVPCPACSGLMQRKNFMGISGVIIDWCADHGSWFDYRELQKIIDFIQTGGLQKVRSKKIENLRYEQQRLKTMRTEHIASRWAMPYPPDPASGSAVSLVDFLLSAYKRIFK